MGYQDPGYLAADLLSASLTLNNSSASTTVLTIPAGRVWKGTITMSICDTGTAAATFSTLDALTAGTGVQPTAGIFARVNTHPGGTAAEAPNTSVNDVVVRAPASNAVTINAQLSSAATTLQGSVSCIGALVA